MTPAEEESTSADDVAGAEPSSAPVSQWIPLVGLAVGTWAVLAPYVGPELATDPQVEVVDHVVPGVAVLALATAGLTIGRKAPRGATFLLASGLAVVLAGIWMVATHVPLVDQATRDEAGWLPVVHHSLPGLAVAALGLVWAAAHWRQTPA